MTTDNTTGRGALRYVLVAGIIVAAFVGSYAIARGTDSTAPAGGVAITQGGVQRVSVDVSRGYYEPSVVTLAQGVPAEVTFSQSSGCTAQVMSNDLGFFEDLRDGAATVALPALSKGEYSFSCGMAMVFGTIVVQ